MSRGPRSLCERRDFKVHLLLSQSASSRFLLGRKEETETCHKDLWSCSFRNQVWASGFPLQWKVTSFLFQAPLGHIDKAQMLACKTVCAQFIHPMLHFI